MSIKKIKDERGHYWTTCSFCGPMVICGFCGNNCCNGGTKDNCPDQCASAYAKQKDEADAYCNPPAEPPR